MKNISLLKDKKSNLEIKKSLTKAAIALFRFAMLVAVGYTVLSPLFQFISNSLKDGADFMNTSVSWIPTKFFFQNYIDAFYVMDYVKTFFNTVIVMVLSAVLEVAACGVAAYGFARFKFPERKILYALLLVTILVPVRMTFLAQYVNFSSFDFFGLTSIIGKIIGKDLSINLINTPFTFIFPSK